MDGGRPVLVTGAAGLIGSAVVRRLAADGVAVVGLDREARPDHPDPGLEWRVADVAGAGLLPVLDDVRPAAIVHCAAHPGGRSNEEPTLDVEVNGLGSMRVFEWCARNGAAVVYTSSSAVYGDQPRGPIGEEAELRPGTVYAVCKLACERWLAILAERYGLRSTVLRLFATYGGGHKPSHFQGIVNVLLTQMLGGSRVVVRGSLERERDLIYVADAADAIVRALRTDAAGGTVINIGTGRAVTITRLIDDLCVALGIRRQDLEVIEEAGTVGDPMYSVADVRLARRLLGFEPARSLADGLAEFVAARRSLQPGT